MLFKLVFYVPASHCELVKEALFAMGAGKSPHYDLCSWQTLGEGQFRPLSGSQPYQGKAGILERIAEYKVEMVCKPEFIKALTLSLLKVHPYEQPAYEIYPILTIDDLDNT